MARPIRLQMIGDILSEVRGGGVSTIFLWSIVNGASIGAFG